MGKVLVSIVWLLALGLGGYQVFPWVADWGLDAYCPAGNTYPECIGHERAMGHIWSTRGDLESVALWYERAAEAGDPRAMFHLAWTYQERVANQCQEDFRRILADQSGFPMHDIQSTLPTRGVGVMDKGTALEIAYAWYRKSAEAGFAPAMNNLGILYTHGLDDQPDDVAAFHWYRKAAEKGNPIGIRNLMKAYLDGRGVGENEAKATRLSLWRPRDGITDDLKNPTLSRTWLFGTCKRIEEEHRMLRYAAKMGDAVFLKPTAMRKIDAVPTFKQVRDQLPQGPG